MSDNAADAIGVIRKAMALRVKYRINDALSKNPRRIQTTQLGVHHVNRGGVYPQFDVVRGLGDNLLNWGFCQEEADHLGVCVQEIPITERAPAVAGAQPYETFTCYNRRQSLGSHLKNCFKDGEQISYGTLSHSHLMLVLRSIAGGARWDLQYADGTPKCCTAGGDLDIDAVALKDAAFANYCWIGLKMEILSWKIMVEEPDGARLISQALNKGYDACLQTTEMTALAVMSLDITNAMSSDSAQALAFSTVKTRLRHELDFIVDEPPFVELYEFVISLGANKNSYIEGFLSFGSKFVDGKKRRLRFEAFAVINKIGDQFPRTKIAVLKRAYHKKPTCGYCPVPEPKFQTASNDSKMLLELLLHYFHQTASAAVAALDTSEAGEDTSEAVKFLANVDVAAAEHFVQAKDGKGAVAAAIMSGCLKYYMHLKHVNTEKETGIAMPEPAHAWIDFEEALRKQEAAEAVRELTAKKKAAVAAGPEAKVLEFDEASGMQLTSQDELVATGKAETKRVLVPWLAWAANKGTLCEGEKQQCQYAAYLAMRTIRAHIHLDPDPVCIVQDENGANRRVIATADIQPNTLELHVICTSKTNLFDDTSGHPLRARVHVERKTTKDKKSSFKFSGDADKVVSKVSGRKGQDTDGCAFTFFLHPEVRVPQLTSAVHAVLPKVSLPQEAPTAAAAAAAATEAATETPAVAGVCASSWKWSGEEAISPFWAIRRLTRLEMATRNADPTITKLVGNCNMTERQMSHVDVGAYKSNSASSHTTVMLPYITNTCFIPAGTELLIEMNASKVKKPRETRTTWKDDSQLNPKKAKKSNNGGAPSASSAIEFI
jgi:hypothetical protein